MNGHQKFLFAIFLISSPALCNESIDSLITQASIHEVDHRHDQAIELYTEAVNLIKETRGELTIELLEPLLGMSRSQTALGQLDEARENLLIAQHVTHREDGVYSPRQLELVNQMSNIVLRAGTTQSRQTIFSISHSLSVEIVWRLEPRSVARLFKIDSVVYGYRTVSFGQIRNRKAMDLIREQSSENDPRLIEFLSLVAKTRRLQGIWRSEKSMVEALQILETQSRPVPGRPCRRLS